MQTSSQLSFFGKSPLELSWTLRFQGTAQEAWEVFSDTHLMNRRVGMKVRYEQSHDADGTPHRSGIMAAFGRDVRFREDTFDYEAPHRVYIQRDFDEGPVRTYTLSINIHELADQETQVDYGVTWFPRNPAARLFVRGIFPAVYGPPISRALADIEKALGEDQFREPGEARFTLHPNSGSLIRDLCTKLEDREIAGLLQRVLLEGDDEEVRRIQPVVFARVWSLPLPRLLDAFLESVMLGLLEVRWELLCPSCQGPSTRNLKLDPEGLEGHCPSCNIAYVGNFADSVGASFAIPSHLRDVDPAVLCVGSPSWTPHILARAELPPRATTTWELELPAGGYRLRELGSIQGAHLEVREGVSTDQAVITVEEGGPRPLRLLVGAGRIQIVVRSRRSIPLRVVLEDRWYPRDVLTAGQLLERPRARELLPDHTLPSDLSCVIRPVGIIATELLDEVDEQTSHLRKLFESLQPRQIVVSQSAVYSTWPSLSIALDAAARLEGAWQLFNSVSHGAVLEVEVGGRREPTGRALEDASGGLRSALPGRSVMSDRARRHPEVEELMQREQPSIGLEEGPRFEDRQDFLVEFLDAQPTPFLAPTEPLLPTIDGLNGCLFGGHYQLADCLGTGGFGVVYDALNQDDEERCVVKLLRPELFTGVEAVQLFFREARALSLLESPSIVRFKDFGHDEQGRLFLVMEHLKGCDLEDLLVEQQQTSTQRAVSVAVGVLTGLAATHAAGLLHRDIKPANIFLVENEDGSESVRLIDFGIAVDQVAVKEEDEEGKVVGTLPYMSVEQLQAEALSPAIDTYALGVVLWRMMVGALPYPELSPMQSAVERVRKGTLPIREVAPEVPTELAEIIDKSLAQDPHDRFPSANAMREALLDIAADLEARSP